MEAGNNLEQSVALIAAANRVVQDPNSVGSALRTISLRLRGTSVKVLEEMGEETDGVVESISKMQAKIKALSGVNILTASGEYKDTYTILKEIGQVWEDMSDIDQAALLELMAGKNRANTLSAILSNMEDLEGAYEAALGAEGSALKENENQLDSIEGRITLFKNALQNMWMGFIDSEVVKFIVDVGTGILKLVDSVGLLESAIGAFVGLKAAVSFIKKDFAAIDEGTLTLANVFNARTQAAQQATVAENADTNEIKENTAAAMENAAGAQQQVSADQQKANASNASADAQRNENQAHLESVPAGKAEEIQDEININKDREEILTNNQVVASQNAENASKSGGGFFGGIIGSGVKGAVSKGAAKLGSLFLGGLKGILISGLISLGMNLLGKALAPVGEWIADAFKSSEEKIKEATEAMEDAISKCEEASKSFKSLKSTTDDIIPRFVKLSKGVDKFGNNISLTDEEYAEFLSLNNQIAELFPEINMGMDSNGNAMLALSGNADTLTSSLEALVEAERQLANQEILKQFPTILESIQTLENAKDEYIDGVEDHIKAISSGHAEFTSEEVEHGAWNKLYAILDEYDIEFDYGGYEDENGDIITTVDWDINQDSVQNALSGFEKEVNNAEAEIEALYSQLNPVITAWIQTDVDFQEFDSDLQQVVLHMATSLDFQKLGLDTEQEIHDYIRNNIITPLDKASPQVQDALVQLFTLDPGDMSTGEYFDEIERRVEGIAESSGGAFTVDELLQMTGYEDMMDQYEEEAKKIIEALEDPSIEEVYDAGFLHPDQLLRERLYTLSPEDFYRAFDLIKDYGIDTWEELVEALENQTFDIVLDYEVEQSGLEQVQTAIAESMSATGLSAESIAALQSRYQDLENYNPARLFEETTHGIHLNTRALRELEKAYNEQNLEDINKKLDGLLQEYDHLTEEIENCTNARERANLYAQRENVLNEINDTATLAAQYEGLTSAYYEWQKAKSGGNQRDMYESIISGVKEVEDELSRGWLDAGTIEFLELLSGRDLSTASYDEILAVYKALNNEIANSGYNIYDFFTTDEDGNTTTEGIFNFFDAVIAAQEEIGENWVTIGENGEYIIDFGVDGDKAVAEALGVSEEVVQILLRAAEDAGFEINLDSTYSQLADMQTEVAAANDLLKEVGATTYTFNIASTDIEDLDEQILEAQKALDYFKNEDGTINLELEGAEEAQVLLATLLYQKQSLNEAAILRIDTSNANTEILNVAKKLQEFMALYNEYEVLVAIGGDTTAVETAMNALLNSFEGEEYNLLLELGINPSASYEEINTIINGISSDTFITFGVDPTLVEGYQAAEHSTTGSVVWENNIEAVTAWAGEGGSIDRLAYGTVVWRNNTDNINPTILPNSPTINSDHMASVDGTAYADGSWGAKNTETSLVGELGPEILVRNGRWTTVGENGAEFTQVKKGDIIFNHKQTEELLKNGRVTGRGKAYASGTAYSSGGGPNRFTISEAYEASGGPSRLDGAADSLSGAAEDIADAADEFREVFDWVEVRLEEIDESLNLLSAQLENASSYSSKNSIIDDMISVNKTKMSNLIAGIKEYDEYVSKLLKEVPEQYHEAVQNGTIDVEEFVGEANEQTLEAINNYREWAQKVADLKQQLEEVNTEIRDLAMQKFDNVYEAGDVRATVEDSQTEKLQNQVDLLEEMGEIASSVYYGINGGDAANSTGMFENSYKTIEYMTKTRKEMQKVLDEAVKAGQIIRGSNEWYEMIDKLYQVDSEIAEATKELEEFQNAINDIYWENFDQLVNRLDYLKDETQGLIDLMDSDDMVVDPEKRKYENGTVEYWTADDVQWTDEGLASLGLYAQQMEIAEYKAKQYAEAIDDLTAEYEAGHYSENEYYEKLNELTSSQYDSIEAYYDAQDAIKELNSTRIDSIKKGIEKEIEAYEELIKKKKEALDADKDMHDFQESIMEQQKTISDIERKLAALSTDNSLSAAAKRKQLEAELAEAKHDLEEQYYDRSIEDQQTALDQELENFQESKDAEITKWEEYLDDIELIVADSLNIVQANASGIYDTLGAKAEEYDLTLSDAILSPWKDGALAVSDYQTTFDTAMSSTMDQLEALKLKWQEIIDKMAEAATANVDEINKANNAYTSATYKEPVAQSKPTTSSKPETQEESITIGGKINAGSARIYGNSSGTGGGKQYFASDPVYIVLDEQNGYLKVRHHKLSSGATGWFKKSDVKAYAKGTLSSPKDQLALIDELGDELRLIPDGNGRLAYMKKGTGVVPADLTANLMEWGKLDPTNMLKESRPQIGISPSVVNNTTEIHIDASVGELIHVEHLDGNNPAEITKIVDKAWDKRMKELNGFVRKYSR